MNHKKGQNIIVSVAVLCAERKHPFPLSSSRVKTNRETIDATWRQFLRPAAPMAYKVHAPHPKENTSTTIREQFQEMQFADQCVVTGAGLEIGCPCGLNAASPETLFSDKCI
jgi:hypothetical protein